MSDFISRFGPIATLVEGIGACAVIAIGLAVLNATAMTMRERTAEVAVLKAIGFESQQVLAGTSLEAAIVAIVGGALGVLASSALMNAARGYVPALGPLLSFGLPRPVMLFGMITALAIGLSAGLLPAYLSVRRSVLDSMRQVA